MDINAQILKANQAIRNYEAIADPASSKKVINSKFTIIQKHSAFSDILRRLFSTFCPGQYHFAQTKPTQVAQRILKLAKSKEITLSQKEELFKIYEKIKNLTLKNLPSSATASEEQLKLKEKQLYGSFDAQWLTLMSKSAPASTENTLSKAIATRATKKKIGEMNALDYLFMYALVRKVVSAQPNAEEEYQSLIKNMGLNDENLWCPYKERLNPDTSGYNNGIFNALLSCYLDRDDCMGIGPDLGKNKENGLMIGSEGIAFGPGLKTPHPIVYFPVIGTANSPMGAAEWVRECLHRLATSGLAESQIPSKLFIPLFCKNNDLGHVMLLLIEPSHSQAKTARITAINTSTGLFDFDAYKESAIQAAQAVYSAKETEIVRNTHTFFSTGRSCGVDVIELIRDLSTAPSVKGYVAKGLKRKTSTEYGEVRMRHAQALVHLYQQYTDH
jgi:hypothetical protein